MYSFSNVTGFLMTLCFLTQPAFAQMHVFTGEQPIKNIDVQAVYYVASDAEPLSDWYDRVRYLVNRMESFHQHEFGDQSQLDITLHSKPFIASATSGGFPTDDVNRFFYHIVLEVADSDHIEFQEGDFPIVLVFSDMNFSQSYDNWTRICDGEGCLFEAPHSECAGHVTASGEDRPGSRCGGSRSVYWKEKQMGYGLVTADGWLVPIRGSDCVSYHEGIGHAINLPHPFPLNNSVMGLAQYEGYIHETWMDEDQKRALGWEPEELDTDTLFSAFMVTHEPGKPRPDEPVTVTASIPIEFPIQRIRLQYQTGLDEPWKSVSPRRYTEGETTYVNWEIPGVALNESVGYRVRVSTTSGEREELWGYYKVRE